MDMTSFLLGFVAGGVTVMGFMAAVAAHVIGASEEQAFDNQNRSES
ncbi:hypothetical protein [Burkholderia sp. ABCPW 14]|nr:hypothetical protein [Burkholderia sp. ABCPW 14]